MRRDSSAIRQIVSSDTKGSIKKILGAPLFSRLRSHYTGFGSILLYHRITEYQDYSAIWNSPDSFDPHLGLSVEMKRFRQQMEYVRKEFTPISLDGLIAALKEKRAKPKKPYIVVTFDDGYLDNLELALPIAEEFEIPITVYVTTGFISRTASPWWLELEEVLRERGELRVGGKDIDISSASLKKKHFWDLEEKFRTSNVSLQRDLIKSFNGDFSKEQLSKLFMSWDELKTFSSHELVTIGAHTVNHPVLSQEDEICLGREIADSKHELEEKLGISCYHFAYPFGDKQAASFREVECADKLQFTSSVTTRSGHVFSKHLRYNHLIPRITIDYFDTLESFKRKVSGVEAICVDPFKKFVTF